MAEIFISHSARRDDGVVDVLHGLRDGLRDAGLEVYLDEDRLDPGFEWKDEVDRALLRCDGAVVVVGASTRHSRWVTKEAGILAARKQVSPGFKLIPVVVPPMTPERLKRQKEFAPIGLDQFQAVVVSEPGPAIARVVEALEPLARRFSVGSPHVLQELFVAGLLKGLDVDLLKRAGETLALGEQDWALADQPERLLARRLLESPIDRLKGALEDIAYVRPGIAHDVFEAVAPFAWIDWAAASAIAEVVAAPDPPRAVGVNSRETLTCQMYVTCGAPKLKVRELTGGFSERMAEEVCNQVREALHELFKSPLGQPLDDATLQALVNRSKPVIVVPHPPPEDAVLEEVKRTFGAVTLFFAAGPDAATVLPQRGLTFVRLLEPELDPDAERDALTEYRLGLIELAS